MRFCLLSAWDGRWLFVSSNQSFWNCSKLYDDIFLIVQLSICELMREFFVAHGVSLGGVLKLNVIGTSLSMLWWITEVKMVTHDIKEQLII